MALAREEQSPTALRGAVIQDSRACPKCKYELRGLRMGDRCPECGTPIRLKRTTSRFADNLTDAAMAYLVLLAGGFAVMGVAMVGVMWWKVYVSWRSSRWTPLSLEAESIGYAVVAGLWLAGSVMVTWKRPIGPTTVRDPILDHKGLRVTAVALQVLPVLAAAMAVMGAFAGNPTLASLAGFPLVASLFATVPLSVYVSSLADWAGDTSAGSRFRGSAWLIAVCGTLSVVLALVLGIPGLGAKLLVTVAMVVMGLLTLIGALMFIASIVPMVNVTVWAMFNKKAALARELRIAERRAREEEAQAERDARAATMREATFVPPPPVRRVDPLYGADDEAIPLAPPEAPAAHPVDAALDAVMGREAKPPPRIHHRTPLDASRLGAAEGAKPKGPPVVQPPRQDDGETYELAPE